MDKEIKIGKIPLITKTDYKGNMTYCNFEFLKISGFSKEECIGEEHNIVRHREMPKIIFKKIWDDIRDNKEFTCILKSKTKNNDFYWTTTKFTITLDHSNIASEFTATRYSVAKSVKNELDELYLKLIQIEKEEDVAASEIYLKTYLELKNMSFEEYMLNLSERKDGFLSKFKS